eukprot:TRINITY_DN21178_c0_g1_i1.p1 TRINITY_DN21178_c0_g1~~TRINITY_DN21178_c0_g1_i1.p1  ORF type:complete len:421 (-),score=114.78 TRINITY_DN21178_c0_g1_i1:100-1362(-)
MRRAATICALAVPLAEAARVARSGNTAEEAEAKVKVESANETGYQPTSLPRLLDDVIMSQCPEMGAGTLIVECLRAENLKDMDWLSKPDPYCEMMISDSTQFETRGFKKKHKLVSKRLRTETVSNDYSPGWTKNALTFHLRCPDVGRKFQLEMVVKEDDGAAGWFRNADRTNGRTAFDLWQIIHEARDGDEKTVDLPGSGSLTYKATWCPLQDGAICGKGMRAPDAKRVDHVDCDQSCHGPMTKEIEKHMDRIEKKMREASSAHDQAEHADDMADHYDDLGDALEDDPSRHEEEEMYDEREDWWEDIEDEYKDKVKKYWKEATHDAKDLPDYVLHSLQQTCGGTIGNEFYEDSKKLYKKFKGKFKKAKSSAKSAMRTLKHRLKELEKDMEGQMKAGRLVASLKSHTVRQNCKQAFQYKLR